MRCSSGASLDILLSVAWKRAGRAQDTRHEDGGEACALWIQAHPRPVAKRGLERECQDELPALQSDGTPTAQPGTQAPGESKLREDRTEATRRNKNWAMDFAHDQLVTGRKIRVLTILDTFSRFSPATDPRFRYRGEDAVQTLERVCRQFGDPSAIRVDQGSEFISRDLDLWAYQKDFILDFSRPSKPTDNAFIESFNGKFRAECLNTHWFMSLDDARTKWRTGAEITTKFVHTAQSETTRRSRC